MSDIIKFPDLLLTANSSESHRISISSSFIARRRRARKVAADAYFAYLPGPHKFSKGRLPNLSDEYTKSLSDLVIERLCEYGLLGKRNKLLLLLQQLGKVPLKNHNACVIFLFSLANVESASSYASSSVYKDIPVYRKCAKIPPGSEFLGAFATIKATFCQDNKSAHSDFTSSVFISDNSRQFSEKIGGNLRSEATAKGLSTRSLFEQIPYLYAVLKATNTTKTDDSNQTVKKSFTWEERNASSPVQEKPYLTEMGPLSTHALLCAFKSRYQFEFRLQSSREILPSTVRLTSLTSERLVSLRKDFIHDLLLAHAGVVSHRFYWKQKSGDAYLSGSFVWHEDVLDTVAFQVTRGCLASCLEMHLHSATAFRRLDWISSRPLSSNTTIAYHGNVWSALIHAIGDWLRVYLVALEDVYERYTSANGSEMDELLALTHMLKPLMTSMLSVAHVCGVLSQSQFHSESQNPCVHSLSGLCLLAWIARQATHTTAVSAVRFLFHRAAAPFLRFLTLWVQGIYEDPFSEFGICVNSRYAFRKDAKFWQHAVGYQRVKGENENIGSTLLLRGNSEQCGALFGLVPVSSEPGILRCGLSLLLLRSIAPRHYLFDSAYAFPCLGFPCLNPTDLRCLLQNHTALINKASENAKRIWFRNLLQSEAKKRERLREIHELYTARKSEMEALEREKREALLCRRRAMIKEIEANLVARRLAEEERRDHARREDAELVKRAANLGFTATTFPEYLMEAEKARLLEEYGEKMSEVEDRIRVVEGGISSRRHRTPLTPVNVEISQQPVNTFVDEAEDLELVENFSHNRDEVCQIDSIDTALSTAQRSVLRASVSPDPHPQPIKHEEEPCAPKIHLPLKKSLLEPVTGPNKAFDGTLAKEIIYGKGHGPTARESAWEKPEIRRPLSEEEILAFGLELIEPSRSKVSPWFDLSKDQSTPSCSNLVSACLRAVGMGSTQKTFPRKSASSVSFFTALDRVINIPLLTRIGVVDKCLLEHFVIELRILDHLDFVKDIYCHGHPIITTRILDVLFSEVSKPGAHKSLLSGTRFQDLIRVALFNVTFTSPEVQTNQSTSPFENSFKRFPFYFRRLQTVQVPESSRYVDRVFNSLALVYNAPWPLNICLHDRVLAKYNTVFCFLARVKYALWSLESVFHFLRSHRRLDSELADLYFQASLWRYEMDQVVRSLDTYLCLHAVQSNWSAFVKRIGAFQLPSPLDERSEPPEELVRVKNLDELCQSHEECVDAIIQCCLMDNEEVGSSVRDSIAGLLESVHQFRMALLVTQGRGRAESSRIGRIVDKFRRHSQSLHRLLKARVPSSQIGAKELLHFIQHLGY